MNVEQGTVDLTRDFVQPIDAVFAAWSSEAAQRAWSDPGEDWEMTFEQFRFVVGEIDICRFGHKGGESYINENRYLVIEPEKRIVCSTNLRSDGRLNFSGTLAVMFDSLGEGTRLRLIEQGLYFDGVDNVENHRAGWQGMLNALSEFLARSEA